MLRNKGMGLVASAVGGAAVVAGAAEMALRRRGDADIVLEVDRAHSYTLTVMAPDHVVLGVVIPFANRGKQQGCILDCTARVLPDGDRYKGLELEARVNNLLLPRDDGYFEAIMFKHKDPLELGVEIHVRGEADVARRLADVGFLGLEFHHSFYMRKPLAHRRTLFTYTVSRATPSAAPSVNGGGARAENGRSEIDAGGTATAPRRLALQVKEKPIEERPAAPVRERVIGIAQPIRTHILTPRDRFAEVVEKYVVPVAKKGDLVAIAESALAIMQGRLYHVEEIQPRWLARKLCRAMGADSSLSTPYGMEMAFKVCGTVRMLAAVAAGVAGKLVGRDGDFYRIAGEDVATIDDASGTLAPFDKYVVLGPVDCREVVDDIKTRFGLECAIVDANDLKKVAVLAVSDPSLEKMLQSSLIDNPQGNAGEQTPVVLIPRS